MWIADSHTYMGYGQDSRKIIFCGSRQIRIMHGGVQYGEILHEWAFVFHEPTASEIQPTSAMSHHITLLPMQCYIYQQ